MATTRSNATVRTKVAASTAMSLLGERFTTLTTVRQPLMLYATWNRMAAMQGMGIRAA